MLFDKTGKWFIDGRYWVRISDGRRLPIIQGGTSANTVQNARFAFGDDDGSESGHSLDTENAARTSQAADVTFLIRIQVEETNSKIDPWTFHLYADKNSGGTYTAVTRARTDGLRLADDTQSRADEEATTERLTAGAGSWQAGEYDDGGTTDGMSGNISLNGTYTDLEFAIEIDSANAATDDYWDLRIESSAGGDLDNYLGTMPRVTAATILNPIEITPAAVASGADSITPTVRLSSVSVTPAVSSASADSIDPSVTPSVTGVILEIDFEENDKSDFDTETGGGNLSVSTNAGMVGTYGMEVDCTTAAGADAHGNNAGLSLTDRDFVRFRFYIDVTNLSMGTGDNFQAVQLIATYTALLKMGYLYLFESGGNIYPVLAAVDDDNSSRTTTTTPTPLTGEHWIECLIIRESTDGAVDGSQYLWIDGELQSGTDTDIDNYNNFLSMTSSEFGANSLDVGTTGTLYLDHLTVRDDDQWIGATPVGEVAVNTFEDGVLGEFDTTSDVDGDMSATANAAMVGSYGLELALNDADDAWGRTLHAEIETGVLRARLYIDTSALNLTTGDIVWFWSIMQTGGTPGTFMACRLSYSGTSYQLFMQVVDDADSWKNVFNAVDISDGEHYIEFYAKRETYLGAADGVAIGYIDGAEQAEGSGSPRAYSNSAGFDYIDETELGLNGVTWTSSSGVLYLDDFIISDVDVEIGEAPSADVDVYPAAVAAGADSVDPVVSVGEVFRVDLEDNDLLEFDSTVDPDNDLSTSTQSAMVGTYGMEVLLDDTLVPVYGKLDVTTQFDAGTIRFRFYFDPNSLSFADPDKLALLRFYTNAAPWTLVFVQLRWSSGAGYTLKVQAVEDDSTWLDIMTDVSLTDEPHFVEVLLTKASSDVSGDGEGTVWVDSVLQTQTAGGQALDNYDNWGNLIHIDLGSPWGADTDDARGTFYLDDLVVRDDDVEIGSGDVDISPVVAAAGADSVDPSVQQDSLNISPTLVAAGADSIDPSVQQDSLNVSPTAVVAGADSVGPGVSVGELFRLDFEENDLTDFDSLVNPDSDLLTSTNAAMVGVYGLEGIFDDATLVYGIKDISLSSYGYRIRVYIDISALTLADGEYIWFTSIKTSGVTSVSHMSIRVRRSGATYHIQAQCPDDDGNWKTFINDETITGEHYIEVAMYRATTASASDGTAVGYIDGVEQTPSAGFPYDNFDGFNNIYEVWLGILTNTFSASSGSLYLDDLIFRDDDTEIGSGPVDISPTPVSAGADSIDPSVQQDSLNISPAVLSSSAYTATARNVVLSAQIEDLIGYWPINETSGPAVDLSPEGNDGTFNGVVLADAPGPDGPKVPRFEDGATDNIDVYSAGLAADFNPDAGTIMGWMKVSGSGIWTDAAHRGIFSLGASATDRLSIRKDATDGAIHTYYETTSGNVFDEATGYSSLDWIHVAMTWSIADDEIILYIEGVGRTPITGLGTWVGALDSGACVIGNYRTDQSYEMDGWVAHPALWKASLSAEKIADIAAIPPFEVRQGSINITPSVAAAGADSVDPTVDVGGDTNVYPSAVAAGADSIDPSVEQDSLNVSPSAVAAGADSIDPSVQQDSLNVSPTAVSAVADSVMGFATVGEIFHSDFEEGDTSEWGTVEDPDNHITVTTQAAMEGIYGAEFEITNQEGAWLWKPVDDYPLTELSARLYFDTNSLTMADNDSWRMWLVRGSGNPEWIYIDSFLRYYIDTYNLLLVVRNDDGSTGLSQSFDMADGRHFIEFHVIKATSDVASDGYAEWWFDGVAQNTASDIDNWDGFADFADFILQVGALEVGTIGTVFYDDVVIRDDGQYIGSVDENITPSAAVAGSDSVDPSVEQDSLNISPTLVDAGADSVDPSVEQDSLNVSPTASSAGADSIDPTVDISGGGTNVWPAAVASGADSINPSVKLDSMNVTPSASVAGADSVDPTTQQGDLSLSPTETAAGADSVAPGVQLGSIDITPAVTELGADSVNPTVQVGDLSLSPTLSDASAVGVDPTVDVGGDVNVSPAAVAAGADSLIGETRQGSISVSPTLVGASAVGVDPTTSQGDLDLTPAVAAAGSDSIDPTVDIAGGGEDVYPAAVSAGTDTVDPSLFWSSQSASPAPASAATATTLLDVQEGEGISPDPVGAGTDTSVTIVGGNNRLIISFARVLIPVGDNLQVFPDPAAAGADSVSPSLYFTSISASPAAVSAGTDVVDPTVAFTDVDITPSPVAASADAVGPTVHHGDTSASPDPAAAGADSVAPTFQYGSISTQALTNANVRTVSVDPTVTGGFEFTPAAVSAGTDTVDPSVVHGDFSRTPEPVSAGTDVVAPSLHWSSHSSTLAPASAGTSASIGEVAEGGATVTPTPASAATDVVDPDVLQIGMLVSTDPASAGTDAHLGSVVQGGGFLDIYPVENYTQAASRIGEVRIDPAAPEFPDPAVAEAHTQGPTVQYTGGGVDIHPSSAYAQAAVSYKWFQVRIGSVGVTPAPASAGADTVLGEVRQHTLWLAPWVKYAVASTTDPTIRFGSVSLWKPPAIAKTDTTIGSAQYGSLDLAPAAATAPTSVVDPTILVQGGYTAVSPALVAVRAVSISPTIQLGSISITPTPAAAGAAVAVGVVLQFSTVDVYPVALSAGTRVVGPRVSQLAMALYPAAVTASTDAPLPTVFLGPEEVTSYPVFARVNVTGPTVGLSGHSVTPGAAVAAASSIAPSITYGSINVSPAVASAIVVSVGPEYLVLDNLYPELDVVIGTWTDKAEGTTDLFDSLDERPEPDDSDYIMNETPDGEVYRADMDEGVDPGRDDHHYVEYRVSKDSPLSQIDLTVTLKEGVTVIATWTHIDIAIEPVTIKQTLTTLQASNIGNYSDLYLEFDAVEV